MRLDQHGVHGFERHGERPLRGKSATSGHVAWFLRPTSNSGNCPKGKIPQLTFTVVQKGTLDVQTMKISYNSHQYLLDLRTDSNGVQIAYANQVA